ncbi:MAG: hypothetical protein A4S16_03495 [Proteobacteria bacterium SG_bin6]|nr:MAG: hypothetical protein A4S16_03495 [Proteobacteria bacterium SG_bin6]
MDGKPAPGTSYILDAKGQPASIDEALRQTFAEMAKAEGTSVEQMLAGMEQAKLEETAATVARKFISAKAGAGGAGHYADSEVLLAKSSASRMRRDALAGGAQHMAAARAVRDAALSSGHAPSAPGGASASLNDGRPGASLTPQQMRDLARSSRY